MENQSGDKVASSSAVEKVFPHSIFVPYDPINVGLYTGTGWPFAAPYEYTGWRDETMSWKETCYLHGNLNPTSHLSDQGSRGAQILVRHLRQ